MKVVIKKQLRNASKRKGGEKTQMMQMIELIRRVLIKTWNCIAGIIFYGLILDHHEFLRPSCPLFPDEVIIEVIVEVSRV